MNRFEPTDDGVGDIAFVAGPRRRPARSSVVRHRILLFALLLPCAAAAGERALSLEEAVEQALREAPQIAAGSAAVDAAQLQAVSAGRLPDPALVVGIDNLPVGGADAYSLTRDFMTMRKVGVMQEFPNRQKRRLQRERAAIGIEEAAAELVRTRLDVARLAAEAWVRRWARESALARLRALEPEVALQAVAARAALSSGRASTAEALAAEAAVAQLANRILAMQSEAQRAALELARWIGDAAFAPLAEAPAFDRLPVSEEILLAAPHEHGALLPFGPRIAGARMEVELARAARRPDWSVELAYAERGPRFSDMVALQFRIELPLFARARQNPLIAARRAELERLEAERESQLRTHTTELRQVLIEWRLLGERLEQYERNLLPLARERSQAALAAYRAGRGDLRLVIEAFTQETDLLIELAALHEERGRAWAFLRYLTPHRVQP